MPREQERRLGREVPQEEPVFQVVKGREDPNWLCDDAERFLHDDLESGQVSLVNDTFLMKSSGSPVGIAVEERFADGGDIIPGVWYKLDDRELRWNVRDRMSWYGETSITVPGKAVWREIRGLRDYGRIGLSGETLLEKAQKAADRIRKSQKKL